MKEEKKEIYAKVHSVESMGTVDGPGIRYVLFLQGCHLKCKYCHNRDTWNLNGGQEKSLTEILENILRYQNYFKVSHGGVTVTGGEPLLQVNFLLPLFKRLKEEGIHTAIDTSGMVDMNDTIKELLSLTDLVLLDIKHIDDEKCKELVGFSNQKELEFAHYLSDHGINMWIRQVLIPGITDEEQDLIALKKFIHSLKTVEKVEILPYHSMGKFKWEKLNEPYKLEGIRNANDQDVKRAKTILEI